MNSVNAWYQADNASGAVITFYTDTGQFVTGGGWILDPAGGGNGKGNLGFSMLAYNKAAPRGSWSTSTAALQRRYGRLQDQEQRCDVARNIVLEQISL